MLTLCSKYGSAEVIGTDLSPIQPEWLGTLPFSFCETLTDLVTQDSSELHVRGR